MRHGIGFVVEFHLGIVEIPFRLCLARPWCFLLPAAVANWFIWGNSGDLMIKKVALFLILFSAGMLVYFVGGYWAGIPVWTRTIAKTALPILLLLFTYACGRFESLRPWRNVSLAFLAASCGFLLSWLLSDPLLGAIGVTPDSVPGIALTKLTESILIVVPVLLIARRGGMTAADLYLGKGKFRASLRSTPSRPCK